MLLIHAVFMQTFRKMSPNDVTFSLHIVLNLLAEIILEIKVAFTPDIIASGPTDEWNKIIAYILANVS